MAVDYTKFRDIKRPASLPVVLEEKAYYRLAHRLCRTRYKLRNLEKLGNACDRDIVVKLRENVALVDPPGICDPKAALIAEFALGLLLDHLHESLLAVQDAEKVLKHAAAAKPLPKKHTAGSGRPALKH